MDFSLLHLESEERGGKERIVRVYLLLLKKRRRFFCRVESDRDPEESIRVHFITHFLRA